MFAWIKDKAVMAYNAAASAVAWVAEGISALVTRVADAVGNIVSGAASVADWAIAGVAGVALGGLLALAAAAVSSMTAAVIGVAAFTGSVILDSFLLGGAVLGAIGAVGVGVYTGFKTGSVHAGFAASVGFIFWAPIRMCEFVFSSIGAICLIGFGALLLITGAPLVEVLLIPAAGAWIGTVLQCFVDTVSFVSSNSSDLAGALKGVSGQAAGAVAPVTRKNAEDAVVRRFTAHRVQADATNAAEQAATQAAAAGVAAAAAHGMAQAMHDSHVAQAAAMA